MVPEGSLWGGSPTWQSQLVVSGILGAVGGFEMLMTRVMSHSHRCCHLPAASDREFFERKNHETGRP